MEALRNALKSTQRSWDPGPVAVSDNGTEFTSNALLTFTDLLVGQVTCDASPDLSSTLTLAVSTSYGQEKLAHRFCAFPGKFHPFRSEKNIARSKVKSGTIGCG